MIDDRVLDAQAGSVEANALHRATELLDVTLRLFPSKVNWFDRQDALNVGTIVGQI